MTSYCDYTTYRNVAGAMSFDSNKVAIVLSIEQQYTFAIKHFPAKTAKQSVFQFSAVSQNLLIQESALFFQVRESSSAYCCMENKLLTTFSGKFG